MSFSTIKDFYDRPPVHATESTFHKLKAIMPLFKPNDGGFFLDIACHDGEKTIALKRLIAPKLIVGIDFESAALSEAKNRGIPCVAIDLNQNESLPFPDASFDCIHAGEIIEHLFSPDLLLTEIARLLKPAGFAVITTPNLASWRNRIALLIGWQPFETEVSTLYFVGNPRTPQTIMSGHIRVFTVKALMELVDLHGLSVDRMIGFPIGIPNSLFARLTAMVDYFVEKFFPMMCDSILIRVSRKINPSGEGKSGRS
jgi:ubiquinone/menaquinone biosynthesis C-methylase UbiE